MPVDSHVAFSHTQALQNDEKKNYPCLQVKNFKLFRSVRIKLKHRRDNIYQDSCEVSPYVQLSMSHMHKNANKSEIPR